MRTKKNYISSELCKTPNCNTAIPISAEEKVNNAYFCPSCGKAYSIVPISQNSWQWQVFFSFLGNICYLLFLGLIVILIYGMKGSSTIEDLIKSLLKY